MKDKTEELGCLVRLILTNNTNELKSFINKKILNLNVSVSEVSEMTLGIYYEEFLKSKLKKEDAIMSQKDIKDVEEKKKEVLLDDSTKLSIPKNKHSIQKENYFFDTSNKIFKSNEDVELDILYKNKFEENENNFQLRAIALLNDVFSSRSFSNLCTRDKKNFFKLL